MLNKQQIKLVQTAVRAAGLRGKNSEGRYRLMLGQYTRPDGGRVTSSTQLNRYQLEDLLAICEALGWRHPGKKADHYRQKIHRDVVRSNLASEAQLVAIDHLTGDLGLTGPQVGKFCSRMTGGKVIAPPGLSAGQAWNIIEALKAITGRRRGKKYQSLDEIKRDTEVTNGKMQTAQG